jgi:hypothetical protein
VFITRALSVVQRNDRGLCFVSALTLLSILIVFVLSLTAIQASVDSGLTAEQKSFHSRDCLVIIYGSITTIRIAVCLRHTTLGVGGRHPYAYTCEDRWKLGLSEIIYWPRLNHLFFLLVENSCFLCSQFLYILYKILTAKSRTIFGMLKIS